MTDVVFATLLRQQGALATFWYQQWVAADANIDRQQAFGKALFLAVSQPRRGKPPDDWRQLVAAAHDAGETLPRQQKAQRLVLIGQTCQIRGDLDLARQYFAEAAEVEPAMGIRAGDPAGRRSQVRDPTRLFGRRAQRRSDLT